MTTRSPAPDDAPKSDILTISQLNRAVAGVLERTIPQLWVRGEISNFTAAASGHWYFTLKDGAAAVRAVMFRGRAALAGFTPREGDNVEARARVSLYEPRGDFQLQVDVLRRAGQGDLFEAFLRLKEKLGAEGVFDPARKREPAALPRALGIVTSLQAAALRDVLTALRRRAPHVPVVLYPAPVQGADAAPRLAEAVRAAGRRGEVDTVLLVRGGGSIEDLWSFNDEALARAIVACEVPVISGVGHETDFTIADFAADVRAPTPTAAAELACLPRTEWLARVDAAARAVQRVQRRRLERLAQSLDQWAGQLVPPRERLARQRERLQRQAAALQAAWRWRQAGREASLRLRWQQLDACRPALGPARDRLADWTWRLRQAQARHLAREAARLDAAGRQLRALGPQQTLDRGYAVVRDAAGAIVRDAAALSPGQAVALTLAHGAAEAGITTVTPERRGL